MEQYEAISAIKHTQLIDSCQYFSNTDLRENITRETSVALKKNTYLEEKGGYWTKLILPSS